VDAGRNAVVVGPRAALLAPGLVTAGVHWLTDGPPADGTRAVVKIRYNHGGVDATLHPRVDGACEARFDAPQAAVTPGQLAVFYDGDRVLGGAAIEHALPARKADVVRSADRATGAAHAPVSR
jgi:tRNA-uridine 2-sulfurtransferase